MNHLLTSSLLSTRMEMMEGKEKQCVKEHFESIIHVELHK